MAETSVSEHAPSGRHGNHFHSNPQLIGQLGLSCISLGLMVSVLEHTNTVDTL